MLNHIKTNSMIQCLQSNLEYFETYMGKPQASYQPSKEEIYLKALNKLNKKNERKMKPKELISSELRPSELTKKDGLLKLLHNSITGKLNYTAVYNTHEMMLAANLDLETNGEDLVNFYYEELKPKINNLKIEKDEVTSERYKSLNGSQILEDRKNTILLNYKHKMIPEVKDEFFALLADSNKRIKDEVINTMIPMQKDPASIISMMKSNLK